MSTDPTGIKVDFDPTAKRMVYRHAGTILAELDAAEASKEES